MIVIIGDDALPSQHMGVGKPERRSARGGFGRGRAGEGAKKNSPAARVKAGRGAERGGQNAFR